MNKFILLITFLLNIYNFVNSIEIDIKHDKKEYIIEIIDDYRVTERYEYMGPGIDNKLIQESYHIYNFKLFSKELKREIGYLTCSSGHGTSDGYYIHTFAISDSRLRKQGFGGLLLKFVLNYLIQNKNAKKISLCPAKHNKYYLFKYYSKFGFIKQKDDDKMILTVPIKSKL